MHTHGRATLEHVARSVLLVDDDPLTLRALQQLFELHKWEVLTATEPWSSIESFERSRPSLVILDLDLPGMTGMRLLEVLRQRDPDATIIMLTGQGDIPTAVQAMRAGAENFLTKPVNGEHLLAAVDIAFEKVELRRQVRYFRAQHAAGDVDPGGLGVSPDMMAIEQRLQLVASGNGPVVLHGETGTGKTWAARLLHQASPRASGPFVEVNAAGLSPTLLDSELFGHERGAFTDAKHQMDGLLEVARGGTLFLDEIGDMPVELQAKFLSVLETQRFRRLGGTREIQTDFRLVTASHRDLRALVREGRFREDLYYRVTVFPLELPPLRRRSKVDLVWLIERLMRELRERQNRGPLRLTEEAQAELCTHEWPGNIRELRNVLERIALSAGDLTECGVEMLPLDLRMRTTVPSVADANDLTLAGAERRHISRVLQQCGNNRARAAAALDISRATLYRKLALPGVEAE
jgi:DNA-binding NtrC family response regulator